MKMKKLLAGLLAGAMTLTSLTLASFAADGEETSSYIILNAHTANWGLQGSQKIAIKKGTNEYTLSLTNKGGYNDSFKTETGKGELTVRFYDAKENLKDMTLMSVSVDEVDKNFSTVEAVQTNSTWDFVLGENAPGISKAHDIAFTDEQLGLIGEVAANSTITVKVRATYDDSAVKINAANFTFSEKVKEEMRIGDSFSITYNSEDIPAESKYEIKYKIPKIAEPKNDTTDYSYFDVVKDNVLNTTAGKDETGLEVSSKVDGNNTIYTFKAVAPTKGEWPFSIIINATPAGDWTDIQYLWFDKVSYKVLPNVPLTGITLNKTTLTLTKGETADLSVTKYEPDDTTDEEGVKWSSDNENVATVDETTGKVTAVAKGTAIIMATSTAQPTVTSTCTVTVENPALESIAFEQSEIALLVGAEGTVKCTYLPADADKPTIKIATTDDSITVTDNGDGTAKVVAVKATAADTPATITATVDGNTTITAATCKVTVTDKEIKATGVKLNNETLTLKAGEKSEKLIPTLTSDEGTPTDKITKTVWASSNEEVATVADGVVTAVAEGQAEITVTVNDTLTAKCTVNVEKLEKPITAVTLDITSKTLEVGETLTLKATLTPADTTDDKTITWTSGDSAVATVDNAGVVKAVKEGTVTIKAAASNGKYTECTITVNKKAEDSSSDTTKPEEPGTSGNKVVLNQKLEKITDYSYKEILNNTSEKLKGIDLSNVKSVIFNVKPDPNNYNYGWNNGSFKVVSGTSEKIRSFGGTSCEGNDWFADGSVIYKETDTFFAVPIDVEKFDPNSFSLLYSTGAECYTIESIEFSCDKTTVPDDPDDPDDTTGGTPEPTPSVTTNPGNFTVPTVPEETTAATDTTTPPPADNSVTPATTQLVNEDSTVKVEFAAGSVKTGAVLEVKKGAETATSATYDITLKLASVAIQPDGTLTITIAVPANLLGAANYYVYRAEADGTYTDMLATFANGNVTFKTGHLSEYVISTVKLTNEGIADGDNSSAPAQNPDDGSSNPANTGNADNEPGNNGNNENSGSTGSTDGGKTDDKNAATGVALALVPAAAAAAAVIISKKRK